MEYSAIQKHFNCNLQYKQRINTFINAAAALRLMTATDSRLRRRGSQFRAERELEKEQSEAVPGVTGVCGTLKPSTSSTMRKARPRDRGSTIYTHIYTRTHTVLLFFICTNCQATYVSMRQNREQQGCTQDTSKLGLD